MATTTQRKCARCASEFTARTADVQRGWARFCSKSCKASTQEQRTGQYKALIQRRNESDYDRDMEAAGHPMASGYFGHGQE